MPVISIQAPVAGINRLSSVDDMAPDEALALDNWIPDAGFCRMRGGSKLLSSVPDGSIGTMMAYGDSLIVAAGGKLIEMGYTPQSGNELPVIGSQTELGTGFTSDYWQWIVFNGVLLMVNGQDAPQQWDGTSLQPINFTSGITDEFELSGVKNFKGRAIYWKETEAGYYYAEAGSYQGDINFFDLSAQVSRLASMKLFFTWSADANDGADDFAVFVMDTGEALVYQGVDPGDFAFWSLIGRYSMGEPISIRSASSIAGDQIILTREGWQNFRVTWETGNWRDDGIGRKIVGLATTAAVTFGNQVGWEAHFFPEERLVIVNVPQGPGNSIQHVMSTNTMAWCTFSGWNATTFTEYDNNIYWADNTGGVHIGMYGDDDDGQPILTDAFPAFNYLSGRARNKQMTAVRPITNISDPACLSIIGSGDYNVVGKPIPKQCNTNITTSPWGSPWGSPWSAGRTYRARGEWQSKNAYGYALSYRMSTLTVGQEMQWFSTQVMFKDSGVI